jgi:hypothetical protein
MLHALNKWHPYLIGRHFKIKIDHDSLKYFLEQRLSLEEQQKWVTKILGYDFEIIYKKGKQNVVAEILCLVSWAANRVCFHVRYSSLEKSSTSGMILAWSQPFLFISFELEAP